MDGCFPLYYPLFYALGSFSSQNFCRFNPTLAGPILDQAGPSRILLNWSDSPASVVRVMAQPAPGQLRVWQKKKTIQQMTARGAQGSSNEYQTIIQLGEEWSLCKAQHKFYVNASLLRKATFRICMYSFTHL